MHRAAQRISRLGWLFSAITDPRIAYGKLGQFLGAMDRCEQLRSFPSRYMMSGQHCEPAHVKSSSGRCRFRVSKYSTSILRSSF